VTGQLAFSFWHSEELKDAPNSELLSAIAGQPAAKALSERYGSLTSLAQASFDELREVPGIGESKASAIRAAFLLAQRLARESYADPPLLDTPDRVADLLREEFRQEPVERMIALLVNTRRRLIAAHPLSQGTLDTLLVHPREVFRPAITRRASAVILAHNHPSGDPSPSEADIRVTRDLIRAGQLLKIEVLDHVILGQRTTDRPKDFSSLRELGYFYSS
jgi:DNA repair protein RadC